MLNCGRNHRRILAALRLDEQTLRLFKLGIMHHQHITTVSRPFFRDPPGEPVPEENFWTLWRKGRLTEADTPTVRMGATPSGLSSDHLHHPPFLQAGCPSCRPINSVKALKLGRMQFITFRVRRRRGEMYIGHGRLYVSVCLSLAAFPHYYTDLDVS